jgi:flagellar biosynthesis/type III secretory pathway chaperone
MFTNIPSATLRQLVTLSERKEALMQQIQELDREMIELQSKFDLPPTTSGAKARVTVSGTPGSNNQKPRTKRGVRRKKS